MKALPLTDKTGPGGRPRKSRAPKNAFAEWLASCGSTPQKIAKRLNSSVSTVYNLRNGYFKPGRDLAVSIAELSNGAVTVESWGAVQARKRKSAA